MDEAILLKHNVFVEDLETGEIISEHNVVTLAHRERYAMFLAGRNPSPPNHIAVGNGRALPTDSPTSFTAMKSEMTRVAFDSGSVANNRTARLVGIVPSRSGVGEINEVGLFDAPAVSNPVSSADSTMDWTSTATSMAASTAEAREGTGSLRFQQGDTDAYEAKYTLSAANLDRALTVYEGEDQLEYEIQFWMKVDDNAAPSRVKCALEWESGVVEWASDAVDPNMEIPAAGGWHRYSLRIADADPRATGSAAFGLANATLHTMKAFSVEVEYSAPSVTYLDDVRLFKPNGNLWAWAQLPTTVAKTSDTVYGVTWFVTAADTGDSGPRREIYNVGTLNVTSSSTSFPTATIRPTGASPAVHVACYVNSGGPIRYTIDGSAPAQSGPDTGQGPISAGEAFSIVGATEISNFRAIRDETATSRARLTVAYFR